MSHMHKMIITLHISLAILINYSGRKFNKIAIIIILITIIIKYRRHIVITIDFILNSRWTKNIILIIVIIIYWRFGIIISNRIAIFQSWGAKKIIFIKTSFPKLRRFHSISNNGVQRIHTNNIAISLQIKFHRFFNFLFKHFMS